MSNRRSKPMRMQALQETRIAYRSMGDGTSIAFDSRSGEVVNTYGNVRRVPPLTLWHTNTKRLLAKAIKYNKPPKLIAKIQEIGINDEMYQAGLRYGALWREVCQPRSPAHSDTTRIIVDGGAAAPDDRALSKSRDTSELVEAQAALGDNETAAFLNRLCGMDDWPDGDKRRFKRICRKGLEVLAVFWRRR